MNYGDVSIGSSHVPGEPDYQLKKANIYYMGKFIFVAILCFIMYNTGSTWIGKIINTVYQGKQAIGATLVCRTTASLAIWFAIHALITICNPNIVDSCQFMIHISWLWLHSLIYFGLWVGCWFIPDDFFDFYMKAAIYISGVYLILQIIFLIDFFHNLNDKFADNERNHIILLIVTIILAVASVVGFGFEFYVFGREGCTTNNIIIGINLALCVVIFIASLIIEHGSIFTASLICAYTAYLTCAALICEPSCNSISKSGSEIWFTVIASIFTLVWAGYSVFSSSSQFTTACDCCYKDEEPFFSLSFFHFLYALASIYLTMIVTHWGQTGSEAAAWTTEKGKVAKWINLGASWVTLLIYAWTLVAPLIFPDREFY